MIGPLGILILVAAWLGTAAMGGALLALLARRIHPSLSFRKLWVFYSLLLAVTVAVVLLIAWF